ncbi:MAG TPA: pyrroline-5-carboxylate reductase [Saprospiraceae bacterium]|nr:pyrroline-5-carboxylate reductase [Saprospiraceae bacterium]
MKILIIGGGTMGLNYAHSFLRSHIVNEEGLFILEKSVEKADELRKQQFGTIYGEPGSFIKLCDLIILAVKPQDTQMLFQDLSHHLDRQQVILSIMAGVKMESIAQALGTRKIIRAMPNLPAQIGSGMTVFTSSDEVTRIELVTVQNLLNASGKTIYVENEDAIDAATAISGSGPAYVFYIMQSLLEAAQEMGFSQAEADLLTYQTFRGAIELYNKFDISFSEWIKKVSSKGGTTEAAIARFESNQLRKVFNEGVHQALLRARDLSKSE